MKRTVKIIRTEIALGESGCASSAASNYFLLVTLKKEDSQECRIVHVDPITGQLQYRQVPQMDTFCSESEALDSLNFNGESTTPLRITVSVVAEFLALIGGFRCYDAVHILGVIAAEEHTLFRFGTDASMLPSPTYRRITQTQWVSVPLRHTIFSSRQESSPFTADLTPGPSPDGARTPRPPPSHETSSVQQQLLKCSVTGDFIFSENFRVELPVVTTVPHTVVEDGDGSTDGADEMTWNTALRLYFASCNLANLCCRVVCGTVTSLTLGRGVQKLQALLICRRSLAGVPGGAPFARRVPSFCVPHETEFEVIVFQGSHIAASLMWRSGELQNIELAWAQSKSEVVEQSVSDLDELLSPCAKFFAVMAERCVADCCINIVCLDGENRERLQSVVKKVKFDTWSSLACYSGGSDPACDVASVLQEVSSQGQLPYFSFSNPKGHSAALASSAALLFRFLQLNVSHVDDGLLLCSVAEGLSRCPLADAFRSQEQGAAQCKDFLLAEVPPLVGATAERKQSHDCNRELTPTGAGKSSQATILAQVPWRAVAEGTIFQTSLRHLTAANSGFLLVDAEFQGPHFPIPPGSSSSPAEELLEMLWSTGALSPLLGVRLPGVRHLRLMFVFREHVEVSAVAFRLLPLDTEENCRPPLYFSLLFGDSADRSKLSVICDHVPLPFAGTEGRFVAFHLPRRAGSSAMPEIVPFLELPHRTTALCIVVDLSTSPNAEGMMYFPPLFFGGALCGNENSAFARRSWRGPDKVIVPPVTGWSASEARSTPQPCSEEGRSPPHSTAEPSVHSLEDHHFTTLIETYSKQKFAAPFELMCFGEALKLEYRCRAPGRANLDAASRDRHLWRERIPRWKMNPQAYVIFLPDMLTPTLPSKAINSFLRYLKRATCAECGSSVSLAKCLNCRRCSATICQKCTTAMPLHERGQNSCQVCQKCSTEITNEMRMIAHLSAKDATASISTAEQSSDKTVHVAPRNHVGARLFYQKSATAIGHLAYVLLASGAPAALSSCLAGVTSLCVSCPSLVVLMFPIPVQFDAVCIRLYPKLLLSGGLRIETRMGNSLATALYGTLCASDVIYFDAAPEVRHAVKLKLPRNIGSARFLGLRFHSTTQAPVSFQMSHFDVHGSVVLSPPNFRGELLPIREDWGGKVARASTPHARPRSLSGRHASLPTIGTAELSLLGQPVVSASAKLPKYFAEHRVLLVELSTLQDNVCGLLVEHSQLSQGSVSVFRVAIVHADCTAEPATEITLPTVLASTSMVFPFHKVFRHVIAFQLHAVVVTTTSAGGCGSKVIAAGSDHAPSGSGQVEIAAEVTKIVTGDSFPKCTLATLPDMTEFEKFVQRCTK